MLLSDAGLVINPVRDYGRTAGLGHRNLYRRILRTPHNVVAEQSPDPYVGGKVLIDANGRVVPLEGAPDDAVAALDRAGPRGAATLGALAGFLFAGNRVTGAALGGLLGYFGGAYVVSMAKKFLAAQRVVAVVPSSTSGK